MARSERGQLFSLEQHREEKGGTEKIKAAARSAESWRCFSNLQMTEGGVGRERRWGRASPP